jgi:hypothetical protein
MPLGEHIRDDIRNVHDKFNEFIMHRKGDINLSLFSLSEIYTIAEHEYRGFEYMRMMLWFKEFQQNLFHIFMCCILFSMKF